MIGGWIVEAAIMYSGNGVQTMERLAGATNRAAIRQAELTGQITAQEAAYLRLQQQAEATAARRGAVFNNVAIGAAAVGAAGIADAVVQAAKLQRTLLAIRNETGANTDAMERFYNTTFKIANIMGVSPATAGAVMLNISRLTAGTMTTRQMQQIAPTVAGFASTINFNRPDVSVEAATQAGIQLSHLFRAYQPAVLERLMDRVYRLSGLMVETPAQAVRQMTYFEPLFKGLKIDDDTSIAMMALLDRAGFRQKVGTNVRAMMLQELGPLQLTKHFQEGQGKILEQMGVFDKNMQFRWNLPGGGVDFLGMLQGVSRWAISQEQAGVPHSVVAKDIYGALGKQGGTIGLLMADPQMLGILGEIRDYLKNPAVSLAAGEANRQQSVIYQASRVWGNLQADFTELGYRATWLSGSLKGLADTLHMFQEWLHGHRTAEDWIGGTTALLTGAATAAVLGRTTIAFLRYIGLIGPVGTGIATLSTRVLALGTNSLGASTSVGTLVGSLGVLSRVASAVALLLGTTSFMPHSDAEKDLQQRYGKAYFQYLKKRHPHEDVYSFNPDEGDLTPAQFRARQTLHKAGIPASGSHGGGGFSVTGSTHPATTAWVGEGPSPDKHIANLHRLTGAMNASGAAATGASGRVNNLSGTIRSTGTAAEGASPHVSALIRAVTQTGKDAHATSPNVETLSQKIRDAGAFAFGAIGPLGVLSGTLSGLGAAASGLALLLAHLPGLPGNMMNPAAGGPKQSTGGKPVGAGRGLTQSTGGKPVGAGHGASGSWGPASKPKTTSYSTSSPTIHIGMVSINLPDVKEPAAAAAAVADLFKNPNSELAASSFGTRTHPNLPQPHTVPVI